MIRSQRANERCVSQSPAIALDVHAFRRTKHRTQFRRQRTRQRDRCVNRHLLPQVRVSAFRGTRQPLLGMWIQPRRAALTREPHPLGPVRSRQLGHALLANGMDGHVFQCKVLRRICTPHQLQGRPPLSVRNGCPRLHLLADIILDRALWIQAKRQRLRADRCNPLLRLHKRRKSAGIDLQRRLAFRNSHGVRSPAASGAYRYAQLFFSPDCDQPAPTECGHCLELLPLCAIGHHVRSIGQPDPADPTFQIPRRVWRTVTVCDQHFTGRCDVAVVGDTCALRSTDHAAVAETSSHNCNRRTDALDCQRHSHRRRTTALCALRGPRVRKPLLVRVRGAFSSIFHGPPTQRRNPPPSSRKI